MKPIIAETGYEFVRDKKFNSLNIYIDGRPDSDLSWDMLKTEIDIALKLGAKLSFELDLGFSSKALLRDPASFFSRGIAISKFEEEVYKPYKDHISAIILYRGDGFFKESIDKDVSLYTDFLSWKNDLFGDKLIDHQMYRIFSMELFMQYLHRVSAVLIDDIPLIALFDLKDCLRPSHQAEILSKSFFPYIFPGIKNAQIAFRGFGWRESGFLGAIGHATFQPEEAEERTFGIALPEIGKMAYDLFDETISFLKRHNISYDVFPESLMTESWHGLNHILVFSETLSAEGVRMLRGFNAAGGEVITIGKRLNLVEEIDLEEFVRSRGI
ncbi:MAG: hypothetical protein FJZ59_02620 [Chlamydiae bacterium]|jgi:hypothetical protein|nr:hypothetical protein [Chlamydiota bacterium]